MLAHIVHEKFGRGLPQFRIETGFRRDGVPIDRGTMSRWLEELGGAVGATIVEAARREAMATAFCISTDATGVAVQPERRSEKKPQACRRGHFFVQIADRDHVFFRPHAHSNALLPAPRLEPEIERRRACGVGWRWRGICALSARRRSPEGRRPKGFGSERHGMVLVLRPIRDNPVRVPGILREPRPGIGLGGGA